MKKHPFVLAIGGNDPMGFSGISADAKSICANGAHALPIIAALTTQDSCNTYAINPTSIDLYQTQIDIVCQDSGVKVIKTGLLPTKAHIMTLIEAVKRHNIPHLIVDPVIESSSGVMLIEPDALEAYRELFSLATLITPNLPESKRLFGSRKNDPDEAIFALAKRYGCAVLLKGGHDNGQELIDRLCDPNTESIVKFSHQKIATDNLRGTGCTLASAIAAYMAQSYTLTQSVERAITYLQKVIAQSTGYAAGRCSGGLYHCIKEQ